MRQINAETEAALKQWESFVPYVYDDAETKLKKTRLRPGMKVRGTATIGYGHTGPDVYPGAPDITEPQALELLRHDLDPCELCIAKNVKVELTDFQFGALVMFAFNAGIGAFLSSTLLKKLNAGNYAAVPSELAKWNKTTIDGKKVVSNGLVNRRAAEAGIWARGSYIQSSGTPAQIARAPFISQDAIATASTVVPLFGSLAIGNGPIQWALAAIAVGGALFGAYLYLKKRTEN